MHVQVDELKSKNASQKEKEAKDIIQELLDETNLDKKNEAVNENGIKPEALSGTVEILKKIVGLNISAGNLKILGPANNILDERNKKSWRILAVSYCNLYFFLFLSANKTIKCQIDQNFLKGNTIKNISHNYDT